MAGTPPRFEPRDFSLARFLLVCGDEVWGHRLREVLRAEGFHAEIDHVGADVLALLASGRLDILGIDLSLPESLGVTLCGSVRAQSPIAIFAVGAHPSESRVLAALAAGADTVIPKEASPREFVARIRALLRRFPPPPASSAEIVVRGPIALDPLRRRASLFGTQIDLDDVGFDLLEALLRKPGRVVLRSELLAICGGTRQDRVLDLHVRRLREKLETGRDSRWISAVRGVGFRFESEAASGP